MKHIVAVWLVSIVAPIIVAEEHTTFIIGGRSAMQVPEAEVGKLLDSLIIDSIVIDNRNIYNTAEKRYDSFLFRTANRLHYKTRMSIVRREVLLKVNDRFDFELADETARNLRARLYLFDAWVEIEILENGHLLVRFVTVDQWSFTSGVAIGRDGNETRYRLQLREQNLLGSNQLLSLDYHIESDRDDYVILGFQDTRILGLPYLFAWSYANDELNEYNSVVAGHPYYNLTQRTAYSATVSFLSGRRDRYNDTVLAAESYYEGERARMAAAHRLGSYKNKLRINADYKYRFEHTSDRRFVPGARSVIFAEDSTYHQFGLGVRRSWLEFVKLERIDGYGFTEDFTLGTTIGLSFFRAFDPDFQRSVFDRADFMMAHRTYLAGHLISFDFGNIGWFSGGKAVRQTTTFASRLYNHSFQIVTVGIRAAYASDWYADGSENLLLGGTSGLRGYDRFFRTGNRRIVFNLESRFHPRIEILSARLGPVLFLDAGRIWKRGDPVVFDDLLVSVGAGLRLYLEKFSSNNILRVDLAYSNETNWEISVGTSQYFSAHSGNFRLTDL